MSELFQKALKFVLRWEGGYVNNSNDKGGATNKGVTQSTFDMWRRSKKMSLQHVKNITSKEVETIYYERYWRACGCEDMSPKFAVIAFDTAVNMGLGRVSEFLKAAQYKYPEKFIAARKAKYQEFEQYGNQKIFLKGWLNRLAALELFINTL